VEPHLPKFVRFHTCTFGEWKNGKVIVKGTMCKMARGQMVRWLAENNVTKWVDIRAFDQMGYRFRPELSTENHNRLSKAVKVADTSDQGKAESKAISSVAVTLR